MLWPLITEEQTPTKEGAVSISLFPVIIYAMKTLL